MLVSLKKFFLIQFHMTIPTLFLFIVKVGNLQLVQMWAFSVRQKNVPKCFPHNNRKINK